MQDTKAAQDRQQPAPGAFAAFARFVLCGGGVGLASSFAVAALACWMPWVLANALITAVSTLLATELHARFTFGAGSRATWNQHLQSAGSAAAAYAVTCLAMFVLHQLVTSPGAALEQAVYLSASALAGVARFVVLRLVVFARSRSQAAPVAALPVAALPAGALPAARTRRPVHAAMVARGTAPADPAALCRAA
ncbi:GtrA family protein [Streptomyces sp. NPDC089799]|uniref:GtrA family protein n=1 Tax=Streptomyces sp. NPDC089799 TaxID=3155066 RepID=UPI0034168643